MGYGQDIFRQDRLLPFWVGDLLTKYLFGNFGNVAISGPASAPQECGVQPPFM
jgi:hypothetical protein